MRLSLLSSVLAATLATSVSAQNATDPAEFAIGLYVLSSLSLSVHSPYSRLFIADNPSPPSSRASIQALTAGGYATLVSIVGSVGSSPEGMKLLSDLQAGPATLLAPSDGALAGVSSNITGNVRLDRQRGRSAGGVGPAEGTSC